MAPSMCIYVTVTLDVPVAIFDLVANNGLRCAEKQPARFVAKTNTMQIKEAARNTTRPMERPRRKCMRKAARGK